VTKKRIITIAILIVATIAADQLTKVWARGSLKGQPATTIIPGYLDLEYHENPGAAFGLLRSVPGGRYILILVAVVAIVLVWRMVAQATHRRRMGDVAFALVVGGALGNVVDRIHIGRVVDFILMHFHRKYVWPAYNVADIALVVGVGLLILVLGRRPEGATQDGRGRGKGGAPGGGRKKKKKK
jgi:signal peptidase II